MKLRNLLLAVGFSAVVVNCGNDHPNQFKASGIVEGTAVKVAAQTGGQLMEVRVEEGDLIEAGQIVAVVDTQKLIYQKQALEAGMQELAVQQEMNENTLELAKTDFDLIKKKYERFQELYEKNSASEQTLDDLKRAYDAARTQLQNAHQSLKVVRSKEQQLQAQLQTVNLQVSDATVVAPLTGTVTTKFYEPGETVAPGFPVVEIIDLQKMWTKVYVSEKQLPRIQIGQSAVVKIDGTDRQLQGVVTWISSKAEFTPKNILTEESRTALVYAVKVTVENRDGILKHGMPVEVWLDLALTDGR